MASNAETTPAESELNEAASSEAAATKSNQKQNAETTKNDAPEDTRNDNKKEVTVDVQTYYQVLIDSRDCPHVVSLLR